MLAGCAAPTSGWRDDAHSRFNSAVSAGGDLTAPEEMDNIRQTLQLADRYHSKQMPDDADRLYQLTCLKSQLLYRNLVLSKVREGASLLVEGEQGEPPVEIAIDREPLSLSAAMAQAEHVSSPADPPPETAPQQDPPPAATESGRTRQAKKELPRPRRTGRGGESPPYVRPENTTLYLTFDDGPSRLTLPIAGFLRSQDVPATFFVLGSNVRGHEKDITATVAMGHHVGNHTLSHNLRKLDASFRQETSEVARTSSMIEKLGGDGRMVRIPYGALTRERAVKIAGEGGQIFDWDIDSSDSTRRGVNNHTLIEQTVISRLRKSGKRHVIILFHDGAGHDATLAAIRNLVPRLKREGYRFGLLSGSDRIAGAQQPRNPRL